MSELELNDEQMDRLQKAVTGMDQTGNPKPAGISHDELVRMACLTEAHATMGDVNYYDAPHAAIQIIRMARRYEEYVVFSRVPEIPE